MELHSGPKNGERYLRERYVDRDSTIYECLEQRSYMTMLQFTHLLAPLFCFVLGDTVSI